MANELALSPELLARVDAIATRSSLTPSQVVANALENGHSPDRQETFPDKVAAGITAADRGDFAEPADRIRNRYRPS